MKKCVVSFADSGMNGLYQEKLKRLENSLRGNFDGDFLGFTDYKQIDCSKTHQQIPYIFKPYAIQKAFNLGYNLVLWLDSPIVAIKSIEPVFDYIERARYLFFDNIGHPLGKWTNEKCLNHFEVSREEAMGIPQIMACAMGFWKGFPHEYIELAEELYPGSWVGHRHDQTVMSFIIHKYGFRIKTAHETFFAYEHFKDVPGWKIADSVCLISR